MSLSARMNTALETRPRGQCLVPSEAFKGMRACEAEETKIKNKKKMVKGHGCL